MFDMPTWRERAECLETAGATLRVSHDLFTSATKMQLSERVLGSERLSRGRADCKPRRHVVEIPIFEGLTPKRFLRVAPARARRHDRHRSAGLQRAHPLACAAVQRTLERDPTLTFDVRTGRFVPAHGVPPPARSPSPPPAGGVGGGLFALFDQPPAPSFPPTFARPRRRRGTKPPKRAFPCPPPRRRAYASETAGNDRLVCAYVRAIADESLDAHRCFRPLPWHLATPRRPAAAQLHRRARRAGATRRGCDAGSARPVSASRTRSGCSAAWNESAWAFEDRRAVAAARRVFKCARRSTTCAGVEAGGRRLWQRSRAMPAQELRENVVETAIRSGLQGSRSPRCFKRT